MGLTTIGRLMPELLNIPVATYRLQLNKQFTFQQLLKNLNYFKELGISHLYFSPIFEAKPGSLHGYDIVDHSKVNPEIGSIEDLEAISYELHKNGMGIILDIVPNHMYIGSYSGYAKNKWWLDVLENGSTSPFADYFDIDWNSPKTKMKGKVLLPLLDEQFGVALEKQTIKITYFKGVFYIELPFVTLPTDPKSWVLVLSLLEKKAQAVLNKENDSLIELESIITALHHLPTVSEIENEIISERLREKEVIKKRLASLIDKEETLSLLLKETIEFYNGNIENPQSFNNLEEFANSQPYRLCYWRVATDEINYRRFFDVFELAGIHTEYQKVFEATHNLIFQLIQKKIIDGVRIDHIDGLWDPEQYLIDFHQRCKKELGNNLNEGLLYTIAEKILVGNEQLNQTWLLHGTVGYDFLNQVNGVFVEKQNAHDMLKIYQAFNDSSTSTFYLIYSCKKLILIVSLYSELHVLAKRLEQLAEQDRSSRDFTSEGLKNALRDVIACFPVYRTYTQQSRETVSEKDHQYILTAIQNAKRVNPAINESIFDFIKRILLLEHLPFLSETQIKDRVDFVLHFQQMTCSTMAKGVEDTAYYRNYPLASLREVGSDPYAFGNTLAEFHAFNKIRSEQWPYSLSTTSTHDTKRSEDVRSRINVLSELPAEWKKVCHYWSEINIKFKTEIDEQLFPDANEEYLLYQTLIGTWPLEELNEEILTDYIKRIQEYMEKATKEAKINTSWINPNVKYDQAVKGFITRIFQNDEFIKDIKKFVPKVIQCGMLNSLSQTVLKYTCPGIPDIYQGNELWEFNLVDPDNRKPIDYNLLKAHCESLKTIKDLNELLNTPQDGRIKLYITKLCLALRQKKIDVFSKGQYLPLAIEGERQNHIIAFARLHQEDVVIVVTSRYFTTLEMSSNSLTLTKDTWKNTKLVIPTEISIKNFTNFVNHKKLSVIDNKIQLDMLLDSTSIGILG